MFVVYNDMNRLNKKQKVEFDGKYQTTGFKNKAHSRLSLGVSSLFKEELFFEEVI